MGKNINRQFIGKEIKMALKHMKRSLTLLIIREIQIKARLRDVFHLSDWKKPKSRILHLAGRLWGTSILYMLLGGGGWVMGSALGRQFGTIYQKYKCRASLVAQWLRVCLPMQGTQVRARVGEDPTCRGATGPVSHNY